MTNTLAVVATVNDHRISRLERAKLVDAAARGEAAAEAIAIEERLRVEGYEVNAPALIMNAKEAAKTRAALLQREQQEVARIDLDAVADSVVRAHKVNGAEPLQPAFRRVDLASLAGREPEPPRFVLPDWLPCGEVSLFAGHGGSGKSAIALMLAVCVALGRDFLGIPTQRRRIAFVHLEDPLAVVHWRLARICAWLGVSAVDLEGWLILLDASDSDAALLTETREGPGLTAAYFELQELLPDWAGGLVIDGASDAFDGNENERRAVRRFVRSLRRLITPDGFVLLLAHVDKTTAKGLPSSQGYSGSTAWSNSVRSRWFLQSEGEDDVSDLLLTVQKSNYAKSGAQLRLRWNDAAHVFVGELAMPASRLDRELAETDERSQVLACIRKAAEAGDPIPAAAAGPRTSWHVLSAMDGLPEGLRLKSGKGRLRAILEQLRAAGSIRAEIQQYGRNRNSREVLVPASAQRA